MEDREREEHRERMVESERQREIERKKDEDGLTWRCWQSRWTELCSRSRHTWSISGAVGYAPPLGHFRTCEHTHRHTHGYIHTTMWGGEEGEVGDMWRVPVMATGECAGVTIAK